MSRCYIVMINIRKANKNDFESYYTLIEEFRDYNNKEEKIKEFHYKLQKKKIKSNFLKRINDKDYIFLFLKDNGKPFGFLVGEADDFNKYGYIYNINKTGYLQNIFISEKYRGKGYSKLLINKFFKYLRNKKIKLCTLHLDNYNNIAMKAYKKAGFKGPIQYKLFRRM